MVSKPHSAPDERQAFGLRVPRASHPDLRRLRAEHTPAHQGWRVWSATWLLLAYLEDIDLRDQRVLDVGCGWGLASAYCARRGARVTAVDLDPEVLPLVDLHAGLNGVDIEARQGSFNDVTDDDLGDSDRLIGADICFRPANIDPLFALVSRAHEAGVPVAIADPGRPTFQALASRCVDELGAFSGPVQTPEPLVAWPGERPLVHGRLLTVDTPQASDGSPS